MSEGETTIGQPGAGRRRWRPISLRTQFVALMVAMAMVLSGTLAWVIGARVSDDVREQIGLSLQDAAMELADRLDREMWTRMSEVRVLASLDLLRNFDDVGAIRSLVERLQEGVPVFSWIGVTDDSGIVVAATGGVLTGESIAHRPVFKEGSKGAYVGDVHDAVMLASKLSNPTGEPVKFVDVAMRLEDATGGLNGVIASHMSWTWARSIEHAVMSRLGERRDMELFVVARDQTVLLAPQSDSHGTSLPLRSVAAAQDGQTGWRVETWPDGRSYVTGYAPAVGYGAYEGLGWVVLARQPVSEAFAPVAALLRDIGIAGGLLAILAAFVGWAAVAAAMAPLRRIAAAADRLRREGTGELPEIRRPEEIRQVSAALRDLVESLTRKDEALDAMTDRAHRDALTNLGNRAALDRFLESGDGPSGDWAILTIDLDGFKAVNDRLGHQAGDRLLQQVAGRIGGCVRRRDFAARQGGDEFVVCIGLDGGADDRVAREIGLRLVAMLGEPYDLDGTIATVGVSIGMAVMPRDGDGTASVLRAADAALYAAKRAGGGRLTVHAESRWGTAGAGGNPAAENC